MATAIEQVKAEIARLREEAAKPGVHVAETICYGGAANKMQWALDLLTATPPAVAALPGKWREEAKLQPHDWWTPYTLCADELDAALKGDG